MREFPSAGVLARVAVGGTSGRSLLAPGSTFPLDLPTSRPWSRMRGLLPGHSGGTVPESHRVPPLPLAAIVAHLPARRQTAPPNACYSRWAPPGKITSLQK